MGLNNPEYQFWLAINTEECIRMVKGRIREHENQIKDLKDYLVTLEMKKYLEKESE